MMTKKKMVPFWASILLFFATAGHYGGVDLAIAFAQTGSTPTWCGQYDGGYCGSQTYCKVPGGLSGCLQWGMRSVYHPKTIQQCKVSGTTPGDDEQTDPSGDCVN